ncbi:MAG: metalloregulator ArsR/SmtB family transcription factor [bacterium]|nr:metalloregulator ArsR/SmtB family transcription factor [bacterium]
MDPKKLELEADFLSALAQPTRLKILYYLKDGEKCACEINPSMKEDASVISRHLVKLREAGILESRREGASVYYWIKELRVLEILKIVDELLISASRENARIVEMLPLA